MRLLHSMHFMLLGSARALLRTSTHFGIGPPAAARLPISAVRLCATGSGPAASAAEDGGRLSRRAARRRRHTDASPKGPSSPRAAAPSKAVIELAAAAPYEWLRDADSAASLASHFAKLEQPKKALELYEQARGGASMVTAREVLPLVMRSLLRMRRVDLALELHQRHTRERPNLPETSSACVLFLALCRTGQLEEASAMLEELVRAHPRPVVADGAAAAASTVGWSEEEDEDEPMWHAVGASMVPALVAARLDAGDVEGALSLADTMLPDGGATLCTPPLHTLTRLVRAFGKARCMEGVYACLEAQLAAGLAADAESMQVLVDALVRSTRFVKGGVSMQTLPTDLSVPEVAFIGRSNVGKSSMVNMVLGRRAIAYTSKTPGKTQQYNYFILNEPSRQQRADDAVGTFHLVDMPGLGYAKVPGAERKKWLRFLGQYAAERPQLRLLVHLIDGQVGPQDTDLAIMRMVKEAHALASGGGAADAPADEKQAEVGGEARAEGDADAAWAASGDGGVGGDCPWRYAIVLTKSDKGGPAAIKRVRLAVEKAVASSGCPAPAGIVATSAKSKGGRHEMWRLMRRVVLDDRARGAE